MDPALLELLACPKSKKPLRMASAQELDKLNKKISAGSVRNIGNEMITEPVTAGLIEPENRILYIIQDNIPRLIYELGIKL